MKGNLFPIKRIDLFSGSPKISIFHLILNKRLNKCMFRGGRRPEKTIRDLGDLLTRALDSEFILVTDSANCQLPQKDNQMVCLWTVEVIRLLKVGRKQCSLGRALGVPKWVF